MIRKRIKARWTREVLIALVAMIVVAIAASLLRGQDRIESYRVVDGDTVHATVDLGWDTLIRAKLRLNGFNAPEKNEPGGPEATQALADALASAEVITVVPTGKKTFDRWVADLFVDGDNVLTHIGPPLPESSILVPMAATVESTPWQLETQAKLDAAGVIAKKGNRNISVVIEPGRYEFVTLRVPPHVVLVGGTGWGACECDLVYVGSGTDTCITVDGGGGYSSGIVGFKIRTKFNNEPNLVGLRIDKSINGFAANMRIDLRGKDCIGVQVAGQESLTFSRIESRATIPVQYLRGDNISFSNCDFGASPTSGVFPSTVLHLAGLPHQITFDGSQTWQGGDHAVYGDIGDERTTGQILSLYGVRWEQSTSVDDPGKPGILIECDGRSFEGLIQIGCRWSARKNPDTVVRSNPAFPLVPKLAEVGCFKPRK